jgi:hypothetical protein
MVRSLSVRLLVNPCPARGGLLLLSQHSEYGILAEGVVSMFASSEKPEAPRGRPTWLCRFNSSTGPRHRAGVVNFDGIEKCPSNRMWA